MDILAAGGEPDAQRRARRRRLVVTVTVASVLTVISVAIGVLLARRTHAVGHHHRRHRVASWREALGVTMSTVGVAVDLVGVVRLRRTPAWAASWRTPLRVLTGRQRRSLLRQVRGQAPVDPDRLPLLRHLAGRLQAQYQGPFGPQSLISAGVGLLQAGNAVRATSVWPLIPTVPVLALYPFALLAMRRDSARAVAFLSRHAAPRPP